MSSISPLNDSVLQMAVLQGNGTINSTVHCSRLHRMHPVQSASQQQAVQGAAKPDLLFDLIIR